MGSTMIVTIRCGEDSLRMWNTLKVKSGGFSHLRKASIESMKMNYKNLSKKDEDIILVYYIKISFISNHF